MAIPAHQVMIFSVYGVDEALVTVRLQASSSEDGMTFGNSVRKSIATTAATVTPENANDQPSRPAAIVAIAATSATTAMIIASRLQPSPLSSCVQTRKPSPSTAVTIPSFSASLPARSRMSPTVLSPANTAPWKVKRASVTSPPRMAYGLSRSQKLPTYSMSASIFTPRTMFPKATPQSTAGINEVQKMACSQLVCHFSPDRLARYSKATPRTIRQTRMISSGR